LDLAYLPARLSFYPTADPIHDHYETNIHANLLPHLIARVDHSGLVDLYQLAITLRAKRTQTSS
jgi:hypothetical protein